MEIALVVHPDQRTDQNRVFFGATVTYEDQHGDLRPVRIVGIDEARIERGEVSWVSPVARGLMGASKGDVVTLRTPEGIVDIEVIAIDY